MKFLKTGLFFFIAWATIFELDGSFLAAEGNFLPSNKIQAIFGANHFDRDFSLTFGAKAWNNEWDLPVELLSADQTQILEFESEPELTYIPTLLLRYRNFYIGGSFLPKTGYDFSKQQISHIFLDDDNKISGSTLNIAVQGAREEYDISVGYFVTPNLAMSLGYKSLQRELTLIHSLAIDESYFFTSSYPLSVHAPILGIAAAAPLGRRLNLYGNLAYGWLSGSAAYKFLQDKEIASSNFDVNGNYTLAELGLNYILPLPIIDASAVSILAAYRFQRLNMKFKGGGWGLSGNQHDATAGFVLGLNLAL